MTGIRVLPDAAASNPSTRPAAVLATGEDVQIAHGRSRIPCTLSNRAGRASCKRSGESRPRSMPLPQQRSLGSLPRSPALCDTISHHTSDAAPAPVPVATSPSKKILPCLPSLSRGSKLQGRSLTSVLSFVEKLLRIRLA